MFNTIDTPWIKGGKFMNELPKDLVYQSVAYSIRDTVNRKLLHDSDQVCVVKKRPPA